MKQKVKLLRPALPLWGAVEDFVDERLQQKIVDYFLESGSLTSVLEDARYILFMEFRESAYKY